MIRISDISCCKGQPIGSVKDFLCELTELAGQNDDADNPVLELQIGEVVSKTHVELVDGVEYLVVDAALPCSERRAHLAAGNSAQAEEGHAPRSGIAWDEDAGRYRVTRRMRTRDLRDDRSVMDAILTTVDDAVGWLDLLRKVPRR